MVWRVFIIALNGEQRHAKVLGLDRAQEFLADVMREGLRPALVQFELLNG